MSSQAKIVASRANGRKSRGPRTPAGKSSASRNAFRHGLAAITRTDPEIFAEIEPVARAICNGAANPLLFEQALIMAENGFVLHCAQDAMRAALADLERLERYRRRAWSRQRRAFQRFMEIQSAAFRNRPRRMLQSGDQAHVHENQGVLDGSS